MAEASGITLKPIHVDNPALQKTVWIKDGEALQEVEIQTGTTTSSMVEVTGGLTEGQEVIIGMETGSRQAVAALKEERLSPVRSCLNVLETIREVRSKNWD